MANDDDDSSELGCAAKDAMNAVERLRRVAGALLAQQARDRPYVLVGAAMGIGFVLGGGIAWRMTGFIANLLGRIAVRHALEAWVESSLSTAGEGPIAS